VNDESYPALFRCADHASNKKQKFYLSLVFSEYSILLLAAILSMDFFNGSLFYSIYAFIFGISITLLLTRALLKPEQDWYRCRALAESVKTLTWRYIMRAEPFPTDDPVGARREFRDHLLQIFEANRHTAEKITSDWSAEAQITDKMEELRVLDLEERKALYASERVQEQLTWYAKKAGGNKRMARNWVIVGVAAYVVAGALVLSRISYPDWQPWPIEPVIVFASSAIGWMQIKKYNELAAAYGVTAQEIGIIKTKMDEVKDQRGLSDFVNEAELAFSREHTLWIARQTS